MKNIKLYEAWNTPSEYEDREPEEVGREIEHTEAEQLFTPIFCADEEPEDDGRARSGNGQIDFDILMDKTPEKSLWAVGVIDDVIPDSYRMLWNTRHGEQYVLDTEAVINFATDVFRSGKLVDGFKEWEESNYEIHLIKLTSPEDIDLILEDLYDYLRPGHATYVGKQRTPRPGYTHNSSTLKWPEIVRVKRAISALLKYKKKIESNTVDGSTQA